MNHPFVASQLDVNICANPKCKRSLKDHSLEAQCEACPNIGPCDLFGDILLCKSCLAKEYQAAIKKAEENSAAYNLALSAKMDALVQIKTDFFNAETVAIAELKSIIENDSTIENKNYKLAEAVLERYKGFKQAIFEKREELLGLENQQKADQIFLNNLAIKLQKEERERLNLNAPDYVPDKPKETKLPAIKVAKEDKNILAFSKMMKIPFEQAKRLYEARLAAAKESNKPAIVEESKSPSTEEIMNNEEEFED